ncbi:glycosyltransferase family 2 protein [Paenibacillus sp. UNC451MF]|uniref:glycosyltransferase family 2 protein n=1 Tax=Paenibacillus sp. UNC451MF TaxID=1449063 RepID=UPI00048AAEEC|nr:glycosyltransferase [Paenibacillus sp. UNC451MF]
MRRQRKSVSAAISPSSSRVSVIIPVMNEKRTLRSVLREARKLKPLEIIVVANGSTDGSKEIAQASGARVISYEHPLGHDVGRSVGAQHASGDILLFIDGDIVIPAVQLFPFIHAVHRGVDVALNRYSGPVHTHKVHPVVLAKHALNSMLGRGDLRGSSMTAIPHALSRKALNAIGAENLSVPPKAQTIAMVKQLRVQAIHHVNVSALNPIRRRSKGIDPLRDLIVGDHLEAIHWLTQATNERAHHSDLTRNRSLVR